MAINEEISKWAQWVSDRIKVPWQIIYSQWSMEQPGAITDPASYHYNLAGLTRNGVPGDWRKFSSVGEFANDYTYSFLLPNYPKTYGASTIDSFVSGLKNGLPGSYFGKESTESYAGKVKGVYNSLFGDTQPEAVASTPETGTTADTGFFKNWLEYWRKVWNGDIAGAEKVKSNFGKSSNPVAVVPKTIAKAEDTVNKTVDSWSKFLPSIFYVVAGLALLIVGLVLINSKTAVAVVTKGAAGSE